MMEQQQLLNKFAQCEPEWRVLLLLGMLLLSLGIIYQIVVKPYWSNVKQIQRTHTELQQTLLQQKNIASLLPSTCALTEDLARAITRLSQQLVESTQVNETLEKLAEHIDIMGLNLRTLEPGAITSQEYVQYLPVRMELSGTFSAFFALVQQLYSLQRLLVVEAFTITKNVLLSQQEVLTITLDIRIYCCYVEAVESMDFCFTNGMSNGMG